MLPSYLSTINISACNLIIITPKATNTITAHPITAANITAISTITSAIVIIISINPSIIITVITILIMATTTITITIGTHLNHLDPYARQVNWFKSPPTVHVQGYINIQYLNQQLHQLININYQLDGYFPKQTN